MPTIPHGTLALSCGPRVGIGDHAYRERGERSNAESVEDVVAVARTQGREPASHPEGDRHERERRDAGGADGRIRTGDLLITNQLLYQLSYVGERCAAGQGGARF